MALNPKFGGQILAAGVNPKTIHTLELYLDYGVSSQQLVQGTLRTNSKMESYSLSILEKDVRYHLR